MTKLTSSPKGRRKQLGGGQLGGWQLGGWQLGGWQLWEGQLWEGQGGGGVVAGCTCGDGALADDGDGHRLW